MKQTVAWVRVDEFADGREWRLRVGYWPCRHVCRVHIVSVQPYYPPVGTLDVCFGCMAEVRERGGL